MTRLYSSGFEPDPTSARDVLAFVLCPTTVFAPGADDDEVAAVAELIGPAKEEAIRRWQEAHRVSQSN
jgi:hypothetical protein